MFTFIFIAVACFCAGYLLGYLRDDRFYVALGAVHGIQPNANHTGRVALIGGIICALVGVSAYAVFTL